MATYSESRFLVNQEEVKDLQSCSKMPTGRHVDIWSSRTFQAGPQNTITNITNMTILPPLYLSPSPPPSPYPLSLSPLPPEPNAYRGMVGRSVNSRADSVILPPHPVLSSSCPACCWTSWENIKYVNWYFCIKPFNKSHCKHAVKFSCIMTPIRLQDIVGHHLGYFSLAHACLHACTSVSCTCTSAPSHPWAASPRAAVPQAGRSSSAGSPAGHRQTADRCGG